MLFQLRRCDHPQDNATPIFFPESKSSLYKCLNDASFILYLFWEDGEKSRNRKAVNLGSVFRRTYSRVPNKRVGGNKHAGGNIFQNLINM